MKDELKKQIENEAKKRLPKLWDNLSHVTFIEGAEYGYNLATEQPQQDMGDMFEWFKNKIEK